MPFPLQNGTRGLVAQPSGGSGGGGKIFWGMRVDATWTQAYSINLDLKFYDALGGNLLVGDGATSEDERVIRTVASSGRTNLEFVFTPNFNNIDVGGLIGWRFPSPVDAIDAITWKIGQASNYKIRNITVLSSPDLEVFTEEWTATNLPSAGGIGTLVTASR